MKNPPRTVLVPRQENPMATIQDIVFPKISFIGVSLTNDKNTIGTNEILRKTWKVCENDQNNFMPDTY